eukprot:gene4071-8099_t
MIPNSCIVNRNQYFFQISHNNSGPKVYSTRCYYAQYCLNPKSFNKTSGILYWKIQRFDSETVISSEDNNIIKRTKSFTKTCIISIESLTISNQHGSCKTMSGLGTQERLSHVCSDAVNYDYYLAPGYTTEMYNYAAIGLLNASTLAILPTGCQASIKKLVCSNVYMKCPPGVILTDDSQTGWNPSIYSDIQNDITALYTANIFPLPKISVPFQRPCKSVCEAVSQTCLGMTDLLGKSPSCSAVFDYSFGSLSTLYQFIGTQNNFHLGYPFQFDQSNNETHCNAMKSSTVTVASTMEPYLKANDPTGACYGYTNTLFVPPGNAVSPLFAPMQPPYVVQSIIETGLSQNFAALPVWLSQKCRNSLKKYFCSSYMLAPGEQKLGSILAKSGLTGAQVSFLFTLGIDLTGILSYSFYLPSYPEQYVCEDYATHCAEFIAIAGQASLVPHCDSVVAGVAQFPILNQTIVELPLSLAGATLDLKFVTSPNHVPVLHADALIYETKCPLGFVVPDFPHDKDVVWIPGSGCAFACKNPVFTPSEWDAFDGLSTAIAWISLPFILLIIATVPLTKLFKRQYLAIIFSVCSMLLNFWFAVMSAVPWEQRYCRNNAVSINSSDGVTMCSTQAFISVYSIFGTMLTALMMSIDVFLRVCLGWDRTETNKLYYLSVILIIPCIPLILMSNYETYGYGTGSPSCFIIDSKYLKDADAKIFYIPILIITSFTFILLSLVITRVLTHVSFFASGDNWDGNFAKIKFSILFLFTFVTVSLCMLSYRYVYYRDYETVVDSITEWTKCVFMKFDGTTDSWMSTCDAFPSLRFDAFYLTLIFMCTVGHSLIVCLIFGPGYVVYLFTKHDKGNKSKGEIYYQMDEKSKPKAFSSIGSNWFTFLFKRKSSNQILPVYKEPVKVTVVTK